MLNKNTLVRGLSVGLIVFSLAGPLQAGITSPVNLAKCSLTDRQPSADGVFRIADTVRSLPATFNVTCLATTQTSFEGKVSVLAYQGESTSEAKTVGTLALELNPPAAGFTVVAHSTLPAGVYQLVVRVEDQLGTAIAHEYRLPVEVAQGETYSAPEFADVAHQSSIATTWQGLLSNWMVWSGILFLVLVLAGLVWRRRSMQ